MKTNVIIEIRQIQNFFSKNKFCRKRTTYSKKCFRLFQFTNVYIWNKKTKKKFWRPRHRRTDRRTNLKPFDWKYIYFKKITSFNCNRSFSWCECRLCGCFNNSGSNEYIRLCIPKCMFGGTKFGLQCTNNKKNFI